MGDDALEAVAVAENPVGHVAAETGAESTLALAVDEVVLTLGVVEAEHEVFKGTATPVSVDFVDELLAVAGGAARIDHDDDVAGGSEEIGVPAEVPIVSPGTLRTAVDEELDGILAGGIEAGRLDEEALHLFFLRAGEPEPLDGLHLDLGQERIVDVGEPLGHGVWRECVILL